MSSSLYTVYNLECNNKELHLLQTYSGRGGSDMLSLCLVVLQMDNNTHVDITSVWANVFAPIHFFPGHLFIKSVQSRRQEVQPSAEFPEPARLLADLHREFSEREAKAAVVQMWKEMQESQSNFCSVYDLRKGWSDRAIARDMSVDEDQERSGRRRRRRTWKERMRIWLQQRKHNECALHNEATNV